jgi:hypothetical protein
MYHHVLLVGRCLFGHRRIAERHDAQILPAQDFCVETHGLGAISIEVQVRVNLHHSLAFAASAISEISLRGAFGHVEIPRLLGDPGFWPQVTSPATKRSAQLEESNETGRLPLLLLSRRDFADR